MRRLLIVLAAGIAVTVPALFGLLGNASFAQRLPLRSPTSATATSDDTPSSSPTSSATPSPTESGDDHGGDRPPGVSDDEPGDDHGGDRPRTGDDSSGHGSGDDSSSSRRRLGQLGPRLRLRRLRGLLGPRLGRRRLRATRPTTTADTPAARAGTTRVATDPTTDPGSSEQSPATSAGDRSVLADELLGPPRTDAAAEEQDPPSDAVPVAPGWVTLGDPREQAGHDVVLSPRRVFVQLALGVVAACSSSASSAPWPPGSSRSGRPSTTPRRWRTSWPRRSSSPRSPTPSSPATPRPSRRSTRWPATGCSATPSCGLEVESPRHADAVRHPSACRGL